jgi:predicted Fe-Mo cluster-binding NifX family protein
MKLAIPTYKNEVAPSFDFSKCFTLFDIDKKSVIKKIELQLPEQSPLSRVQELKKHQVDIIICNAIRSYTERLLHLNQVRYISRITGTVNQVIRDFLQEKLQEKEQDLDQKALVKKSDIHVLIDLGKQYFQNCGFTLSSPDTNSKTFIDFIGEKRRKEKRKTQIAVCCGAHIYKVEEEIREFAREIGDRFDIAYYIHPGCPGIKQICDQYKVVMLDPEELNLNKYKVST